MRFLLPLCLVFAFVAQPALAREQIRIVGSSTVYPFVAAAAEMFGEGGGFRTPIVESTGTGGGFKLFCDGLGDDKPDVSNASRPITDSEKALCAKHGVTDIVEIPIGYDGIIIVSKKGNTPITLTRKQLFLALARDLPDANGKLGLNPNKTWKDVDASLPNMKIELYGPPPTSGTRDAFVELVMEKGCQQIPEFSKAVPDEKERKKACHMMREDGGYVESGEDDNIIVQKVVSNERAFGILGYGFFEENTGKIQATPIEGVVPSYASIESGAYSIARSLFVYVKKQHIGKVPGIVEFTRELTSDGAMGEDGYMTAKGLLPLSEADRKKAVATVKALR